MAKASPAFQIYPADYLASTSTFTDAESGVYAKLLFWSWTNGPLPLDEQRIRRAAQSSATDAEWLAIWATLEPKWTRTAEGYINNRLERTRKEQEDYRERQKGNGAKGGRPKTQTKPTDNPVVPSGVTQTITQQVTQTEPRNNPSVLRSSSLISDLRSSPLPSPESEVQTKSVVQKDPEEKIQSPRSAPSFDAHRQHLKAAAYAYLTTCEDGVGDDVGMVKAVREAAACLKLYDFEGKQINSIVYEVRGYLASVSA